MGTRALVALIMVRRESIGGAASGSTSHTQLAHSLRMQERQKEVPASAERRMVADYKLGVSGSLLGSIVSDSVDPVSSVSPPLRRECRRVQIDHPASD